MIDKYVLRKLSQNTDRIQTIQYLSKLTEATFSSPFILYRVVELTGDKTFSAGGRMMEKLTASFRIYQSDIDQSGMPEPKIDDRIIDADGDKWVVDDVVDQELQNQLTILKCQKFIG